MKPITTLALFSPFSTLVTVFSFTIKLEVNTFNNIDLGS